MAIIVGSGDFKYRIVEDWAKLPDGWSFKEVGAVGVDAKDNVMCSTAASTQSWCSIARAISCVPGVRGSTRGRTVSIWGPTIRSI